MNRGYDALWLSLPCANGPCNHDRGYHGPPLDARGQCLVRGCPCSGYRMPDRETVQAARRDRRRRR